MTPLLTLPDRELAICLKHLRDIPRQQHRQFLDVVADHIDPLVPSDLTVEGGQCLRLCALADAAAAPMSAINISLHDYIDTLRLHIPRDMHPYVYEHLSDAEYYAQCGDMQAMAHSLGLMRDKIVQELHWEADNAETAG
jgi:hypothetical protein